MNDARRTDKAGFEERSGGGQAALTGFLYQILGTLRHLTDFSLQINSVDHVAFDSALFILEPLHGDLQIETNTRGLIEQYKSRSTGRPWSAKAIVEQVCVDLWAADQGRKNSTPSQLRFVTDGDGPRKDFVKFLELARNSPDVDSLNGPQDGTPIFIKYNRKKKTPNELLIIIANALGADGKKVEIFNFLRRLEICSNFSVSSIESEIDDFLRKVVDEREDIPNKRKELIGRLLKLSSVGKAIDARSFFKNANLPLDRLFAGPSLVARMKAFASRDVDRIGYLPIDDVRESIPRIPSAPIAVISGESGLGKTWLAARLATDVSNAGGCAILLRGGGGNLAGQIQETIADRVWQRAGFDRTLSIGSITDRLENYLPKNKNGYWLTIFIDDPQADANLSALSDLDLDQFGIQLVFTSDIWNASALKRKFCCEIGKIEAKPFTIPELRSCLRVGAEMSEAVWTSLPDDMLSNLRRPIYAGLYRKLESGQQWTPSNEYELMERYWSRIYESSLEARVSVTFLTSLCRKFSEPEAAYPWTIEVMMQAGFGAENLRLLVARGALTEERPGVYRIGHDRLLNWITAAAFVTKQSGGLENCDEITRRLCALRKSPDQPERRSLGWRFGYLLMDIVWLLCKRQPPRQAAEFISSVYKDYNIVGSSSVFISELMPTVGSVGLPALTQLAAQMENTEFHPFHREIAQAIVTISEGDKSAAVAICSELIGSDNPNEFFTALCALRSIPAPDKLDLLWERHSEYSNQTKESDTAKRQNGYFLMELTADALDRAILHRPQWIDDKLRTTEDVEQLSNLVWRLQRLPTNIGGEIWGRRKEKILASIPEKKRVLATAIHVFNDRDCVDFLEASLSPTDQDHETPAIMRALNRIAPDRAANALVYGDTESLSRTSGWWLRDFILNSGDVAREAIRSTFLSKDWESGRNLALMFLHDGDLIDQKTIAAALSALAQRLRYIREHPGTYQQGAGHIIRFLRHAPCELVTRELSDSRWDELLSNLRYFSLGNDRDAWDMQRDDLKDVRCVMLMAGAAHFRQFIKAELATLKENASKDAVIACGWIKHPELSQAIVEFSEVGNLPSELFESVAITLAAQNEQQALYAFIMRTEKLWYTLRSYDLVDYLEDSHIVLEESDMETLRTLLRSSDEADCIRGLWIAKLLRVKALSSDVIQLISKPLDDHRSLLALEALREVGVSDPTVTDFAQNILSKDNASRESYRAAVEYLGACSGEEGRRLLFQNVCNKTTTSWSGAEVSVMEWLRERLTQEEIEIFFTKQTDDYARSFFEPELKIFKAERGDEEALHSLRELLFSADGVRLTERGQRARLTRKLSKLDPDFAFSAARRRFEKEKSSGSAILLWDISADRALSVYLNEIDWRPPLKTINEIGRDIREYDDAEKFWQLAEGALSAMSEQRRYLAVSWLGWRKEQHARNRLKEMVDDASRLVKEAAAAALQRWDDHSRAKQLLELFEKSDDHVAMPILLQILDIADPFLVARENDPISIWPALAQKPPILKMEAIYKSEEQRKEYDRKLNWEEQKQQ